LQKSGLGEDPGPDCFLNAVELASDCCSLLAVFFVHMGKLGELVAVALIEAMSVEAGAARSDTQDGETALPRPGLDVFAEAEADAAIPVAVFDHESTYQGVGCGLEMIVDGNFDPAHDFVRNAGHKCSLVLSAGWKCLEPYLNVLSGTVVAELLGEQCNLVGIADLNGTDEQLWRSSGRHRIVHVNIVSCRLTMTKVCDERF